MNKPWDEWVEIGKALSGDPTLSIKCPVCKSSDLVVRDVVWEQDVSRIERHITCPNCGAANSILMKSDKKEAE